MTNGQIDQALNNLPIGSVFRTPDNAVGVDFSIANITNLDIRITLNSGNPMSISRQAFFAANDYLHNNSHDINNPVRIASSNEDDESGDLCLATKTQNDDVRCINYIVPILQQLGGVGYSGTRPNTCWYI